MYYALNLVADISRRDGFFELADVDRNWAKMPYVNGTWTYAGGTAHDSNPTNGYVPRLAQGDFFHVGVFFKTGDVVRPAPERVNIIVTIARLNGPGERIVASPFKDPGTNSVISVFGEGINAQAGPSVGSAHGFVQSCGPVNADFGVARGTFRFEFTVVARFKLANGTWIQFSIDPELDVDVNSK